MPVIIEDLQATVTDNPEPAGAAAAAPADAAPPAPTLQAWLSQRDLVAEREARLAID